MLVSGCVCCMAMPCGNDPASVSSALPSAYPDATGLGAGYVDRLNACGLAIDQSTERHIFIELAFGAPMRTT
jgi:hypothetical protein